MDNRAEGDLEPCPHHLVVLVVVEAHTVAPSYQFHDPTTPRLHDSNLSASLTAC